MSSLYLFKFILTYLMVTVLFSLFRFFHCSLQALLLPNGWRDLLSLFRHLHWYQFGSFYLFKLGILTYPYCCMFYFHIFALFTPLQVPLLIDRWGDPLSLFRHH